MYRTRIQSFVQLENDLKAKNEKLRDTITNVEHSGHDTVAVNLRRFDQYQVNYETCLLACKIKTICFIENYFAC